MAMLIPFTSSSSPNSGMTMDSVRYPCAMVLPNGPAAARCGSTWIHGWSPVASAKVLTRSWVTSSQPVLPRSAPACALSSSRPFMIVVMPVFLLRAGQSAGPVGLAQRLLEDLAGRGPWQAAGEPDGLGDLVPGEPAVQESEDLL